MAERTTMLIYKQTLQKLKQLKQQLQFHNLSSVIDFLINYYQEKTSQQPQQQFSYADLSKVLSKLDEIDKKINELINLFSKNNSSKETSFFQEISKIDERISRMENIVHQLDKMIKIIEKLLSDDDNLYMSINK